MEWFKSAMPSSPWELLIMFVFFPDEERIMNDGPEPFQSAKQDFPGVCWHNAPFSDFFFLPKCIINPNQNNVKLTVMINM